MSQRTLPSELVNEEKTFSVLEDSLRRSKRVALLVVFLSWMVSGSILAFVQPGPSVSTFALWAGRLLAFFLLGYGGMLLMDYFRGGSWKRSLLWKALRESPESIVWLYLDPKALETKPKSLDERGLLYVGLESGERFGISLRYGDMEQVSATLVSRSPNAYPGYTPDAEAEFVRNPIGLREMKRLDESRSEDV